MAAAQSACGPKDVRFDAVVDKTQHPTPQPEPDKAIVYVVQDLGQQNCWECLTAKIGMDRAWVGANEDSSYIFFFAEPGEHHLCVNWQSHFASHNKAFAMAKFTAEAGRTYYFRTRLSDWRGALYLDLDPINSDQGKYLVVSLAFSVWHTKK
jgi:hypothetical protein